MLTRFIKVSGLSLLRLLQGCKGKPVIRRWNFGIIKKDDFSQNLKSYYQHISDRQKEKSKTKEISKAQFIDEEVGKGGIKKKSQKQAAAMGKL